MTAPRAVPIELPVVYLDRLPGKWIIDLRLRQVRSLTGPDHYDFPTVADMDRFLERHNAEEP